MQTSKTILQRIANDLNINFGYGFTVYKETLLSSEGNCFGIGIVLINKQYVIKFMLKKEYATYFCYLDKTSDNAFIANDTCSWNVLSDTVKSLLQAQCEAIRIINDTWLKDNETLASAIKTSRAICEATNGIYEECKFPYLYTTEKNKHQIFVSGENRIHIKTFDISLEQALKIIEILEN